MYVQARDGNKIYVREFGVGEPVLLLHGFGMHSGHWLPFILTQSLRYRFLLPDWRGFGKSRLVGFHHESAVRNYADDLHDILEHYGIEDATVGGISMGALTMLEYFRVYGTERIGRYLHMDQAPAIRNHADWAHGLFGDEHHDRFSEFQSLIEFAQEHGEDHNFADLPSGTKKEIWNQVSSFFSSAMRVDSKLEQVLVSSIFRIPRFADLLMPMESWQAYLHCMRSYVTQDYDYLELLPQIDIPVTIMAGMKSAMYPPRGQRYMADVLPAGEFVPFYNSGHTLFLNEPFFFVRKLSEFLKAAG